MRTAARIAWRETRSSLTKFLFVVLAVAAGVGALSGVRGFSESFHTMLTTEARTVMAADLAARQFAMPTDEQIAALDALAAERRRTHLDHRNGLDGGADCAAIATPVLAALKAVDPSKYPYYGEMKLQPGDAARGGADAGYRGRGRGSADPPASACRRYGARRRTGFSHRRGHRFRAGPHVGQPEHRHAADDVARSVRSARV